MKCTGCRNLELNRSRKFFENKGLPKAEEDFDYSKIGPIWFAWKISWKGSWASLSEDGTLRRHFFEIGISERTTGHKALRVVVWRLAIFAGILKQRRK